MSKLLKNSEGIYKALHIFFMTILVLIMSFLGVFFVVEDTIANNDCDGDIDCNDSDCNSECAQTCDEGDVVAIEGYVDYVDIGSSTSEAGLALTDWSDWSDAWVKPGWGGNYGGGSSDESFRLLMGHGDGCGDTYEEGTIIFDVGSNYVDNIVFKHLDGSVDDSFDVYINNVAIGHYTGGQNPGENWVESSYNFSPVTGVVTVKFFSTEPDNEWCANWGQVAFSWVGLEGYECESLPTCGDGTLDDGEECDDGPEGSANCTADCTIIHHGGGAYCGDGSINQSSEQCDDGNTVSGDGCSSDCKTEGGGTPLCILTGTCGGSTPTPELQVLGESGTPDLSITKTIDREFANAGDTDIAYSVTIINNGDLTAYDAVLIDALPVGLKFTDGGGINKDWLLGDIEPGKSVSINYSVDVAEFALPLIYTNTATVSAMNNDPVSATADLEIRAIEVLAETGFSANEFMALIATFLILAGSAFTLRRKYYSGERE